MLPFRKILFPVDYSEPCRGVIPYVKEMVRHFSAELTVVHAYGPEALANSKLAITDPGLPEEARAFEEQRLREFALETRRSWNWVKPALSFMKSFNTREQIS